QHLQALAVRLGAALRRRLATASQRLTALERHLQLLHPRTRLEQRQQRVDELQGRLERAVERRLVDARARLDRSQRRLQLCSPVHRLRHDADRLTLAQGRLAHVGASMLERRRERLAMLAAGLQARSPLATLARGYAIVTDATDSLVYRPQQVPPGAQIRVRVAEGSFEARVIESTAASES
ncbi:MAG: exodeoxyribonuclease VII large subunit, partial [Chromatiaceae bacterium]|nr:exodeoxyribonuclease VII large subunit [Chromatiaceae bacterium]